MASSRIHIVLFGFHVSWMLEPNKLYLSIVLKKFLLLNDILNLWISNF
jgi:hypothetical protein